MRVAVVILASRGSAVADSAIEEIRKSLSNLPDVDSAIRPEVILKGSLTSSNIRHPEGLRGISNFQKPIEIPRSLGVPRDDEYSTNSFQTVMMNDNRAAALRETYAAGIIREIKFAKDNGFTHAITLDLDRHHSPTDLSGFLAAIEQSPEAIINGYRHLPPGRLPMSVRFARLNGDLWNACAAGRWTRDIGFSYRAIPLVAVADLSLRSVGRELDVEMLVKAIWAGVKVVQIPVAISAKSRPQMMSPGEFFRFGRLTTSLLMQRLLLPTPLLATIHRQPIGTLSWRKRIGRIVKETVRHHSDRPATFAAAVGVGVFFGIAPVWGFQFLLAAMTAHLFRVSKPVALAASAISSPLTIPLILYASLLIGHALHTGQFTGVPRPERMEWAVLLPFLGEYLVGSIILASVAGFVAAMLAFVMARAVRARQSVTAAN